MTSLDDEELEISGTAEPSQPLLQYEQDGSTASASQNGNMANRLGNQRSLTCPRQDHGSSGSDGLTPTGRFRAYLLGFIICIGGFLFGYDTGIIGGVLTMASFESDHGHTKSSFDTVSSLSVSLQQLGAFVACFAIWPITHKYGRKWTIALCSLVFCIGAATQTAQAGLGAFYFGRVVAGLGLGGSSAVVPMYSAEMAPKQLRGQIGSFYQLMFTFGIFTSYWLDYAVVKGLPASSSAMWQIPAGLQILFAGSLGLGMVLLEESVRWLVAKGRYTQARKSLEWIRASDGPDVEQEMREIRTAVEREAHGRKDFRLTEMLHGSNLRPTLTAVAMFTAQQATGASAFAYYGPQYFSLLVGDNDNLDLLLVGIFGAVKVAACLFFVFFLADRYSRKSMLTTGALIMATFHIATAALDRTHSADDDSSTGMNLRGFAMVTLIYLFVTAYNFSWGPLTWLYVSEIFPARTREPGIAIGVAWQWLFSFFISLVTPYLITKLRDQRQESRRDSTFERWCYHETRGRG
ncbi:general substrate transporter [Teratosphaeria nubilosa]|uniref:General substrate transporter n=1 Tax=Teratosphaeria nubilosa TaxID=161662 RepID=A0A6G1KUJ6_9PEZI|nr:general substrate transporter [Teratosphaeria nubilosa]